jgi:hypothetical protein
MNINNFYKLLFDLYASQEGVKIKYVLDDKIFSTNSFKEKHKKQIDF